MIHARAARATIEAFVLLWCAIDTRVNKCTLYTYYNYTHTQYIYMHSYMILISWFNNPIRYTS